MIFYNSLWRIKSISRLECQMTLAQQTFRGSINIPLIAPHLNHRCHQINIREWLFKAVRQTAVAGLSIDARLSVYNSIIIMYHQSES
jgi:hypothetical protein